MIDRYSFLYPMYLPLHCAWHILESIFHEMCVNKRMKKWNDIQLVNETFVFLLPEPGSDIPFSFIATHLLVLLGTV